MMKNIPEIIYLQVDPENERPDDFNKLAEVAWCEDQINNNDLVYKRIKSRTTLRKIKKNCFEGEKE